MQQARACSEHLVTEEVHRARDRESARWPPARCYGVLSGPVACSTLVPLFFVVVYSVSIGRGPGCGTLVVRPRVAELLLSNTARLVVGCSAHLRVSAPRRPGSSSGPDLPGRAGSGTSCFVAPLAVPAFVNSFGWVSLTARVEGYGGALLMVTLSYYPLGLPARRRGAAPDSTPPWRRPRLARAMAAAHVPRVTLPQLRPALLGGALLVGLHLLAEFGALQLLRFPTFTTAIYDQYQSTFNGPAATRAGQRAGVRLPAVAVVELRVRGDHRYARVGRGAAATAAAGAPRPRRAGAGRSSPPALSSPSPSVSRSAAWLRWLVVGSSTAFPLGDSLVATTLSSLGLGADRRGPDVLLCAAGGVAVRAPPRGFSSTYSSAAPTSATRCPGSWSPSRW